MRISDWSSDVCSSDLTGFTAGIAVIIASSQVKDFLGLSMKTVPADFIPKWSAYFSALGSLQLATLAIGVGSLVLIIALRKWAPRLPGFLNAVVLASAVVEIGRASCRERVCQYV